MNHIPSAHEIRDINFRHEIRRVNGWTRESFRQVSRMLVERYHGLQLQLGEPSYITSEIRSGAAKTVQSAARDDHSAIYAVELPRCPGVTLFVLSNRLTGIHRTVLNPHMFDRTSSGWVDHDTPEPTEPRLDGTFHAPQYGLRAALD